MIEYGCFYSSLNILDLSYHIEWKGLDHLCEGCIVAPINQQSGNREGDQDDQAKQESQRPGNAGGDRKTRQLHGYVYI